MAVPIPILTATSGADWEGRLLADFDGGDLGVVVVRRCVDAAELLAAAAAGQGRAALLAADLRRLDGAGIAMLLAAGVAPVGVAPAGDPTAEQRLRAVGVAIVVGAEADARTVAAALTEAVRLVSVAAPAPHRWSLAGLGHPPRAGIDDGPPGNGRPGAVGSSPAPRSPARPPGTLIAVWGPTGAPGRTTVAATLGAELAALGRATLLVDADVYGGVLAAHLGILDESPGLAAVARLANAGTLDAAALVSHTLAVLPSLTVLTGIARADRWPELRPTALATVWRAAREVADVVVVDCGFCLETDEELSFDTIAPRRNGATLATLEAADVVLAVAGADPVGLQRLVRGLDELRELLPDAPVRVVVNRLRRGPIGRDPEGQIAAALQRFAGVAPVAFLPDDRVACDSALGSGRTVSEAARDSRLRREVAALARSIVGVPAGRRRAG